jgi:nitrous oxide reductase accessory protein NosL
MKSFALALALPLALAGLGCAGSQKDADTTPEPVATTLTAEECGQMVDHMAGLDASIDRDAALADCQASGDRQRLDCVMAAESSEALADCDVDDAVEPTEPTEPDPDAED